MNTFWQDLPRPFFILAPMEAVTDVVFRHVIAHAAKPDIFFTEFTNASSFASEKGIHSTRGRLTFTEDEQPMVAQIWGNKPDQFAFMARGLADMGYSGIDINMGCPDKSVVKGGSGSGLIRTPELAAELIAATKEGGLPVSVKTRLGYSTPDEWRDWLTHLLKQDIVNLTIHLRTRKEMSKVDAHFELIPEIKKLRDDIAPQTLLTINGDIRDRQHGKELVAKYGVDGIMIGRGIFSNPFAFEMSSRSDTIASKHLQPEYEATSGSEFMPGAKPFTSDGERKGEHSKEELLNLLRLHLDLFDKYSAELEPRRFEPLKRFFKIYIRDFPGASELREQLMHTKTTDEVRACVNGFENTPTGE
jgi:tRNA-dihydrouridine synthase